jgi:hypothetical protein
LTRIFDYAALCYNAANTVYFIPMRLGAALLDVALLVVMRHFTTPPFLQHLQCNIEAGNPY